MIPIVSLVTNPPQVMAELIIANATGGVSSNRHSIYHRQTLVHTSMATGPGYTRITGISLFVRCREC